MKVNIGPYPRYIVPSRISDKIFFWVERYPDDESLEHRWDYVLHEKLGKWLDDTVLAKVFDFINTKRTRKVKVKIDKFDTWNMDSTLAVIILPMLKQLKETKQGSPGDMSEFSQTSFYNDQYCFDFYRDGDNDAWDAGHRRWTEILGEIIWAFEQIQPDYDWEDQYWENKPDLDINDSGKIVGTKGEADFEGMQRHSERIRRGLELFGKYYQALWD